MTPSQAIDMAKYNKWMNERLYAVCGELTDTERKKNCQTFFKSIHGTLNHILVGDKLWLSRFLKTPTPVRTLDEELHSNFDDLRNDRIATDSKILEWAETLSEELLATRLLYTSMVKPKPHSCEMWLATTHFFNHQTHHRGQITTLLSQFGKEYGVTDLIALPDVVLRNAT